MAEGFREVRVAVTVDPEIPVPPALYGGIERIVDLVVRGLRSRGHDVTLFAHPDSRTPSRLEPYPGHTSRSPLDLLRNTLHVTRKVRRRGFDLVHGFGRLAYMAPLLPLGVPVLMSYQRTITPGSVRRGERLARGPLHFAGCSRHLIRRFADRPNWHVVYNGVPMDQYRPRVGVDSDAPLVFLGRIQEIKGTHLAARVALTAGRRLIIAGNVPEGGEHRRYFEERVRPLLDGERIRYVGPVDDRGKDRILGEALALLMPVQWDEPFGIVMAEALACGTPVVGLRRGAVPEVVENGVNGFVCDSVEDMVLAVGRVTEISRQRCRRIMEERFSDRAVVEGYEAVYRRMLASRSTPPRIPHRR